MIKLTEKSLINLLQSSLKADNVSRVVVGGLVKNEKGEVLILKRSADDFMGGLDELPSGKMNKEDQTVLDALRREIKEEANLDVTDVVTYLDSFDYKSKSGVATRQFNFGVEVADLKQVKISEEHQDLAWYSMYNMHKSNMSSTVRDVLFKDFQNQLVDQAKKENVSRFVVGGLVLNEKKEILLLKRAANDFMGGLDELPSGKVDKGEELIEALKREIKEETNLSVESVLRYFGHFDYKSKSGTLTRQFNFEVATDSANNLKLSEEHEASKWVTNSEKSLKGLNVSENVIEIIRKYYEEELEGVNVNEEDKTAKKRKISESNGVSNNHKVKKDN